VLVCVDVGQGCLCATCATCAMCGLLFVLVCPGVAGRPKVPSPAWPLSGAVPACQRGWRAGPITCGGSPAVPVVASISLRFSMAGVCVFVCACLYACGCCWNECFPSFPPGPCLKQVRESHHAEGLLHPRLEKVGRRVGAANSSNPGWNMWKFARLTSYAVAVAAGRVVNDRQVSGCNNNCATMQPSRERSPYLTHCNSLGTSVCWRFLGAALQVGSWLVRPLSPVP
jgi:hypothetical protein